MWRSRSGLERPADAYREAVSASGTTLFFFFAMVQVPNAFVRPFGQMEETPAKVLQSQRPANGPAGGCPLQEEYTR